MVDPGASRRSPTSRSRPTPREERRLFYVAMTRARERLILSGAARLESDSSCGGSGAPIGWIAPALVPDLAARVDDGSGVADGVRFEFVCEAVDDLEPAAGVSTDPRPDPVEVRDEIAPPEGPRVRSLSYTSLATYARCGYRFYAERVLGLPEPPDAPRPGSAGASRVGTLTPAERGSAVHALLERLDFRRPLRPSADAIAAVAARPPTGREATEIAALVERFGASEICRRLGRATRVRREQPFAFPLAETLITGALDVIGSEREGMLIVDYKTNQLKGRDPAVVVERQYQAQRLIYALAVLPVRGGTGRGRARFLEAPEHPVTARYGAGDREALERELAELASGVLDERFEVTETRTARSARAVPPRAGCAGGRSR